MRDTEVTNNVRDGVRCRAWTWTWNNYTEDDVEHLKNVVTQKSRYIIFGREIAPTTGTPHLQGYVYFTNARTREAVKKVFNTKVVHLDPSRGTADHNQTYCGKDNNFFEFGDKPAQGKRTDLDELRDTIVNGTQTVEEIAIEDPMAYHRYGRTLEKIEDITQRSKFRTTQTTCLWITGKTGSGKSHKAFLGYDPKTHYLLNTDDKGWWDGYTGQNTVIINDFKGEIRYGQLLQLIDKWAYSVPRRNRQPMPFTSKHIIITSIMKPEDAYKGRIESTKDGIDQLLRRITVENIDDTISWED